MHSYKTFLKPPKKTNPINTLDQLQQQKKLLDNKFKHLINIKPSNKPTIKPSNNPITKPSNNNTQQQQIYKQLKLESISLILDKNDNPNPNTGTNTNQQLGKLYLGNYYAAKDIKQLQKLEIQAVLTIANGLDISYHNIQPPIHHLNIFALDQPSYNISVHFNKAIMFIEDLRQRGYNVFVHCAAGMSRSATIVIVYLIWKYKINFEQAYKTVKFKRFLVHPNTGFIRHIKQFEYFHLYHQNNNKQ